MSNNYGMPICSHESTQSEGFDALSKLALDMRWSWNHEADEIWQQLDPVLWEQTHNPWIVLQTVSGEALKRQLSNPSFRAKVDSLLREKEAAEKAVSWFSGKYPGGPLTTVAYFSMEFMLSEALPIYVGGLGNVAGDQLKTASDLGVPVVAVGLLYQQGYFRQEIDRNGEQKDYYPYNDPGQLPISPLRGPGGDWFRLAIPFPGGLVWLRAWQVRVGRARLFLLDSNDAANPPAYRNITAEVYGGDNEMRIKQEIVLGIGGWRLLETLGIQPEICHLNEGHAAFAVLERARSYMDRTACTFEEALTITRAGNLFTSHTAVAAGFDHFDLLLMSQYLGAYATKMLRISIADLLALGRQNPQDLQEGFNMAYLAIRGSGAVNGVSALHGRVSRHLFEPLFQRWPTAEVPVGHVTNGVHVPSWDSAAADALWTEACGADRWLGATEELPGKVLQLPDDRLWAMRSASREALVSYIRVRLAEQLAASASPQALEEAKGVFDPNVLTLGFARRFVPYKRPDLLLRDPARLVRLLTNSRQPVQLVIAGKAPPTDQRGRDLIKRWVQFISQWNISRHVIFLSDYDMLLAEHLVQGVDVWLNTPQRPWEASGTSGMKVLVNGGLNLSELDGWWVEAYRPEVGWALGDGQEHGDDPAWDGHEAEQLFQTLEQQVVPMFYRRNDAGVPVEWLEKVRQSMATLTPFFSANRTVREYTEKFYVPGAKAYADRAGGNGALGKRIVLWRRAVELGWPQLRFGGVTVQGRKDDAGREFNRFEVQLSLGDIPHDMVLVELYAMGLGGGPAVRQKLELQSPAVTGPAMMVFGCSVPADRPASDYTARVIPWLPGASVPLETGRILWQR